MNTTVFFGRKQLEYYDGLLVRADTRLHAQIASIVTARVKSGASVLDMGAGQGALAARFADLGYLVTAVDNNDEDYLAAGRNIIYRHVNFDEETALDEFIRNNTRQYDLVCGVEVIEHVENPWSYVRGLKAMTKPGGMILITTPNTNSWLSRLLFLRTGQFLSFEAPNVAYGHINPVSNFELKLIMEKSGLQDVEIHSGGTLPPLYFSSAKTVLYSLLALMIRPFQRGMLDGWCAIAIGRK